MDKDAALIMAAKDLFLESIKKNGLPALPPKTKPADHMADEFLTFLKRLQG